MGLLPAKSTTEAAALQENKGSSPEGLQRAELEKINILYIEDNPDDFVLLEEMLANQEHLDCSLINADRLSAGLERLSQGGVDIVLLDLSLPDSHGFATFQTLNKQARDLPVIVMTGLSDETMAVRSVQEGAQDYLVKGQVDANLLVRAIRYAIEREKLTVKLRDAIEQVKILRGFIPICSSCKKIRDDQGFWQQLESYIRDHSEAEFTHGICPACTKNLYGDWLKKK